jgi:hypothetical protein
MNLYWVETPDHHEDWFVVARSARRAARWHEMAEGYEDRDAWATLVRPIPRNLETPEGWPSHELLEACGARLLRSDAPRVVEIAGGRFVEGYLEHEIRQRLDERFEALGEGRPNGTTRLSIQ